MKLAILIPIAVLAACTKAPPPANDGLRVAEAQLYREKVAAGTPPAEARRQLVEAREFVARAAVDPEVQGYVKRKQAEVASVRASTCKVDPHANGC